MDDPTGGGAVVTGPTGDLRATMADTFVDVGAIVPLHRPSHCLDFDEPPPRSRGLVAEPWPMDVRILMCEQL